MVAADTYPTPKHGWTCFHCGDHFPPTMKGQHRAREHFGADPSREPGCLIRVADGEERGLLMALRRAEAELDRYRVEDSDTDRRMAAMASEHGAALRSEEEKGYARGLRDGAAELKAARAALLAAIRPDRMAWCIGTEHALAIAEARAAAPEEAAG